MMDQEKLPTNSQEISNLMQTNDHTNVVNEADNNPYLNSLSSFTGKLRVESNKIVEWQIKKDIETKELGQKLNKLEELIEKQRKNLFEQQMQCENISQEYANEVKQKESLEEKAKNTLNICNVLQDHYQKVNLTFESFVKIKDDISNNHNTIKENYAHLKQKFDALHSRLCEEIGTYKEKYKFQNELHMMKKKEQKQLQTCLEEKLQYYENEIMKMKDVHNKLRSDLESNNKLVQQLTENKSKATTELTEKIIHLEGNLSEAINMKNIIAKEVDAMKNNVFEFEKLQEAYTNSQDKRNELSNNLIEIQKKVKEITVLLKEDQETNNTMLNENCQLSDKIEGICASVEEYKNLLREESEDKAKLQAELFEANTNLQQIMNDIEELVNSSETEIIKLNEVIADLNKEFEEVCSKHGEYVRQTQDLEHVTEQSMKQVKELNEEIETLKEAVAKNVEKLTLLKEDFENIKTEKSQMDKTLSEKKDAIVLTTNDNDILKSEINQIQKKQEELEQALINKQQAAEQTIQSREMECSTTIKELLASMDEYKLSYGTKQKNYDQEHKELTEKICQLEKDNKELLLEKKIAKEKLLFHENSVANMETKFQIMESQIFQLKLDIENEKRKGFEASVNKVTEKKEVDQLSNSPKRFLNVLTSTPKRVCFDDWSDVTDDSCMDLNLFKVENMKIVPQSQNQIRYLRYYLILWLWNNFHVTNSTAFPEQVKNEVTSSTIVPNISKEPARNVKYLKKNSTPPEQNIFASFLK